MLPDPSSCQIKSVTDASHDSKTGTAHIIDVRTPECYEAAHIKSSENFCIYQTDFSEKIQANFEDKDTVIYVYGDGEPYMAAFAAYDSLKKLGYQSVYIMDGGIKKWAAEGKEVVGNLDISTTELPKLKRLELVLDESRFRWVGRNLKNQHFGDIKPEGGFMEMDPSGNPSAGVVTLNMQEIVCLDIADSALNKMLIQHLSSIDFFQTDKYPTASFSLTSATPKENVMEGRPNYSVDGVMSVRGVEQEMNLEAMILPFEDGVVFQTVFQLDRTAHGALYGSGSIFEKLGMHIVNDLISLDVTAVFK